MKDFEHIGKQLPYREHDGYVGRLVEHATEQALSRQPKAHAVSMRRRLLTAAAAALLIAGIGVTAHHALTAAPPLLAEEDCGPIDEFLDSLTDEDAQLLAYYDIEEIPEYE